MLSITVVPVIRVVTQVTILKIVTEVILVTLGPVVTVVKVPQQQPLKEQYKEMY